MKKIILTITSALMFCSTTIQAQITLDFSNDTLAFSEVNFYCIDISENESKYVIINKSTNSFSLYNMDMSPFLTNIAIPFSDSIKYGFVVAYITKTLFDCDSTNIEYVYQSPYDGIESFRILRTDGTVLLEVDSARGPYCFGCWGGAMDGRPIKKTSAGTKLFLDILNPSGRGIQVYSLCGELPTEYVELSEVNSYVKLFPNPSGMTINFEVMPPNNAENFELVIHQNNGGELKKYSINTTNDKYTLDVSGFSNGIYLYSLVTRTRAYQNGKFIITK